MTRTALIVALAIVMGALALSPVAAQGGGLGVSAVEPTDGTLSTTADRLREDLSLLTRVASTAALAHDAEGTFPSSTFGLLGSRWASQTGLRSQPFSSIEVSATSEGVDLLYVPLPADPYDREDEVVTLTLTPEGDGRYRGTYQILRRADPDVGGHSLPYHIAGRYRVERAFGTFCVEASRIRSLLAEGPFVPDPTRLSDEPLTVRVHPPGEDAPIFFERTEPAP